MTLDELMTELAACVCAELEDTGAGPTCWCGVWPGEEVAWDFCDTCDEACGIAWVRVVGVFPYDSFPVPVVDLQCARPLAYAIEAGVMRCIPVSGDEEGTLPSPPIYADIATASYADMMALYRALLCCPATQIAVEGWVPAGPSGGCVGGAWSAFAALD